MPAPLRCHLDSEILHRKGNSFWERRKKGEIVHLDLFEVHSIVILMFCACSVPTPANNTSYSSVRTVQVGPGQVCASRAYDDSTQAKVEFVVIY